MQQGIADDRASIDTAYTEMQKSIDDDRAFIETVMAHVFDALQLQNAPA